MTRHRILTTSVAKVYPFYVASGFTSEADARKNAERRASREAEAGLRTLAADFRNFTGGSSHALRPRTTKPG